MCRIKTAYKRMAASDDDDDISPIVAVKKTPGWMSPASPEAAPSPTTSDPESLPPTLYVLPNASVVVTPHESVALFKPDTPNEMMPDVADIVFEEVVGNKIIHECLNSHSSLETITRDMCQDIAAVITSTAWQKEIRRQILLTRPQLK